MKSQNMNNPPKTFETTRHALVHLRHVKEVLDEATDKPAVAGALQHVNKAVFALKSLEGYGVH